MYLSVGSDRDVILQRHNPLNVIRDRVVDERTAVGDRFPSLVPDSATVCENATSNVSSTALRDRRRSMASANARLRQLVSTLILNNSNRRGILQ